MKVDVLCTDPQHPINPWLDEWRASQGGAHEVSVFHRAAQASGGDVLFLVSCSEFVSEDIRRKYRYSLVLHASDLPQGRGWSPHIWAIVNGEQQITVSLLDAADPVDSGDIWARKRFEVEDHALHDEINNALFRTELALMDRGLQMIEAGEGPLPQATHGVTYLPQRRPENSELDPERPLAEQFDKLRVADPERYPAFFRLRGYVYTLEIKKLGKDEPD